MKSTPCARATPRTSRYSASALGRGRHAARLVRRSGTSLSAGSSTTEQRRPPQATVTSRGAGQSACVVGNGSAVSRSSVAQCARAYRAVSLLVPANYTTRAQLPRSQVLLREQQAEGTLSAFLLAI
jgi:hypothetical protein